MSVNRSANGNATAPKPLQRADELNDLYDSVKDLIIPFVQAADEDASAKKEGHGLQQPGKGPRTTLVEYHPPQKLNSILRLDLPDQGLGKDGLMYMLEQILQYSVNTWDQGFLDKLYAAPSTAGLAADMVLSAINTNLHVYQVSPALTVVEKQTAQALARMFGFNHPYSGGVSQPGGSAANQSSIVIARNCLYPETKSEGYGKRKFVLFTSAHGHYSLEKAAQMFGFGSNAARSIAVDERGCMKVDELESAIVQSQIDGETPFYVNATAGTTVLGSFDPLDGIASICRKYKLWMHVDGSWGGPVIFSDKHKYKLRGIERADSVAICPHKMMGIPVTCSFLIGQDLRQFHKGMTLPAGYLFHNPDEDQDGGHDASAVDTSHPEAHTNGHYPPKEYWDLADLTPQCGRRGDSLKLALTWIYKGTTGIEAYIDHGFEIAAYFAALVASIPAFSLLSENPPPCLQVCFYFNKKSGAEAKSHNSKMTEDISRALVPKGFMVDYAPGDEGKFFRVVVNGQTQKTTVDGLVAAIQDVGQGIKLN